LKTIKSIDTCNKTIKINEINGLYNVTLQIEEEIQKIIPAYDLSMAMVIFDEVEKQVNRNFN
jgi:hypothetical protein